VSTPPCASATGDSPTEAETSLSIADRFQEQVRRGPRRVAIQRGDEAITYAQLNETANRLARVLRQEDPTPSRQIALLFDQGQPQAVAAMLGVLKAGNVYVPLDPTFPVARTAYMLEHSQAQRILTTSENRDLAKQLAGGNVPVLDVGSLDPTTSGDDLDLPVSADAPAYILYTSGSTGRPKGVVQTHRNLLHFVGSYSRQLQISAADRLTFFYSYSFSASLMDIYGALLGGATLLPYDLRSDGISPLAQWLRTNRITVYHSVPTVFRNFLATLADGEQIDEVRVIDLGGEPVYQRDVELFASHFPTSCRLINHLAFTEASVSAQWCVERNMAPDAATAPVGYDAPGVRILLVDDQDREVSHDAAGEIVVQSDYLSPGYWRDEQLTEEAFRPLPRSPKQRCYRTGDLGRRSPDGLLVHLGRRDARVKIRGHSVELAEIEQALLRLPQVKEAVVRAVDDGSGRQRLAAYVVPTDEGQALTGPELRTALKMVLPDFMIPRAFVRLTELPLTATGKVDRRALQPPDFSERYLASPLVAPGNDIEEKLASIWTDVLEIEQIGIHDDFFDLGGDSLLAVRMLLEVERQLRAALAPSVLAHGSTIAALAERCGESDDTRSHRVVVTLSGGTRPPLFLVPPAAQTSLMFHDLAEAMADDQPLYALNHLGMEGVHPPHRSVEAMAAYFNSAIRQIQPEGPYYLGGMCFGCVVAFEMARQLRAHGQQIRLLAMLDTMAPPGMQRSPTGTNVRKLRDVRRFASRFWYHVRHGSLLTMVKRRILRDYHDRFAQRFREVFEAHKEAKRDYRPEACDVMLSVFRSGEWRDEAEWLAAWKQLTTAGVQVIDIAGGHGRFTESFIRHPHVADLAAKLTKLLDKPLSVPPANV